MVFSNTSTQKLYIYVYTSILYYIREILSQGSSERLWNVYETLCYWLSARETQTNRSAVLSHVHHVNIHIIQQESASIALFPFNPILHRAANPGGIHSPPPQYFTSIPAIIEFQQEMVKKKVITKRNLKIIPPNIKKVTKIC